MLESTREVIIAQRDSLGLGLYAAERQRARSVAKTAGAGKYAEDALILSPAGECAGNTVHGGSVRSRAGGLFPHVHNIHSLLLQNEARTSAYASIAVGRDERQRELKLS